MPCLGWGGNGKAWLSRRWLKRHCRKNLLENADFFASPSLLFSYLIASLLMRLPILLTAAALCVSPALLRAEKSGGATPDKPTLETQIETAWQVTWERFYLKDVQTFGDYLSSYEKGKEQAHLPTADEVKRQYPNPCGYSTGMEDGMILGGAMLALLSDRYAVTKDETLRARAAEVFSGMRRCATVHGVPGYIARNVCPEDQTSVYINSSRDQYTHYVHGLWKYYHSPLVDEAGKEEIRTLMTAVAERMLKFVIPENDYDFCRADGQRCPLGICRMWNVKPHEAARLPMIYAVAWEVTQKERYREAWRQYAAEAIAQSAEPNPHVAAYALLQMQCSLEVLHELEPDVALKAEALKRMQHVAKLSQDRLTKTVQNLAKKTPEELAMLGPDWRQVPVWKNQKGYPNPQWGPYREVWHLIREAGESSLVILMLPGSELPEPSRQQLQGVIQNSDYLHNSSCGIVYHLAAYWKAKRHGRL